MRFELADFFGRETETEAEEEEKGVIESLFGTLYHFFSKFFLELRSVGDPRQKNRIQYPLNCLLFTGILMFLCRLGSRRQIRFSLSSPAAAEKYGALFSVFQVPHGDTLEAVFRRLKVHQVAEIVSRLTETLIRKKVLYPYRLLDRYFMVVIDGTGMLTFAQRHCPRCLWRRSGKRKFFYHPVLEAKLVTATGFTFSLMTEFLENSHPNVSKQDSELKAFYRLIKRLKKRFPRLPICLVLDAMFAKGSVFFLCDKYRWKFIITLKDSILASLHQEFEEAFLLHPEDRSTFITRDGIKQKFRWANQIPFTDSKERKHFLNVLECIEIQSDFQTKYKWVTNLRITNKNFLVLSNQGGRLRWKIENEGFNVQKNGGFGLEHAYSRDPQSLQIFYYLLQIAHILAQLVEKGSLFKKIFPRGLGSSKNLAAKLKEEWIYRKIPAAFWLSLGEISFQIRFNSS